MENEKKKKSKKVVIIVGILVLFFVILLLVLTQMGNIIYGAKMIGVDKDIKIEVIKPIELGGYANNYTFYYIDIDKKKIYEIDDYYVFGVTQYIGQRGHHYSIEKTGDLTDKQITDVIEFIEETSKGTINEDTEDRDDEQLKENEAGLGFVFFDSDNFKYKITYNDIKIEVIQKEAPIITQIINDM